MLTAKDAPPQIWQICAPPEGCGYQWNTPTMICPQCGRGRVDDDAAPITHPHDWQPIPAVDEPTTPMRWTYDGGDPALMLFTAAVDRFNMVFPPGARILELGCAESDWLERMHQVDRSYRLYGIDARRHTRSGPCGTVIEGSAMNPHLFSPGSFDWIVLLGALEHFGLGFYGDPEDEIGDRHTMENVYLWLKPGGFVYFDVPCQPTHRVSANRHFRSYSPQSVTERLIQYTGLQEINRGYSLPEPHAGTWCHEPTVERVPYWFVAVLCQKVGG